MIAAFLSKTLNRLLQADTTAVSKLKPLENKVLTLECVLPIPLTLQCTVEQTNVVIHLGNQFASDTKITGTPLQLFRVGILQMTNEAFLLDDLVITGDTELAERWLRLFREADIDVEELFANIIGDVPAHKAGQFFDRLKNIAKGNLHSVEVSVHDYLHEESEWFPNKTELLQFFDEVDEIRLNTDRLVAKIALARKDIEDLT